jgi:plastocyanin
MRQPKCLFALLLTALTPACEHDAADPHAGHDAATDAVTADTAADSGGMPLLNECAAMDYQDLAAGSDAERTVRPRGTTGYTPRCLTVRLGQRVTFEMDFATHPLVPGIPHGPTAGATSPNPITRQTAGSTYGLTFEAPGYFPFYCNRHGHVGMLGVVRVLP